MAASITPGPRMDALWGLESRLRVFGWVLKWPKAVSRQLQRLHVKSQEGL